MSRSFPIQPEASIFSLAGKVALVTGGTRGIGKAIAMHLAEAGARVILSSEDIQACNDTETELRERGCDVRGIVCDVTDPTAIEAIIERTTNEHGSIDVLVCNAGVAGPVGPIHDADPAAYQQLMEINLHSVVRLTSLVIPGMAERGGGSVIIMSSIAGLRGNKAIGVYALAKAAVAQLARNLAVEWGPANVRVNSISPGLIDTEFARGILSDKSYLSRRLSLTPLRRLGRADEIAGAALFLASAAGGFVTGHNLVVDGGTLISDGN
jgi:NAD(P)-dependent dehydrogenase (short-subunit alcohol dehydrogenase family)